jgi:cytochrome c-type biogenesis protein CcmH
MLGRAYMALGRYDGSVTAFARLRQVAGDTANTLVRHADAMAMAAGGKLAGEPAALIARALELDPQHRTALWLAGMAAMERGDPAGAIEHWQTLIPLLKDENTRAEVARLIEQAGHAAPAPGRTAATTPASLTVHVQVAPEFASRVPADAVVFVTARAPGGPPMPLAVTRRPASALPFDVVLDDSLSMAPEWRLSQHETVDVTARVSASGQAERETGDLVGESQGIRVGNGEPVTLTIDTVVP